MWGSICTLYFPPKGRERYKRLPQLHNRIGQGLENYGTRADSSPLLALFKTKVSLEHGQAQYFSRCLLLCLNHKGRADL